MIVVSFGGASKNMTNKELIEALVQALYEDGTSEIALLTNEEVLATTNGEG